MITIKSANVTKIMEPSLSCVELDLILEDIGEVIFITLLLIWAMTPFHFAADD